MGIIVQLVVPTTAAVAPLAPRTRLFAALALPAFEATPDYPQILSQPIFSPSRTGSAGAGGGAGGGLTLVGIGSTGRAASAILRGPDGTDHVLSLGETLSGWTLSAVTRDQAHFTRGTSTQVLTIGAASSTIAPSGESASGQSGNLH